MLHNISFQKQYDWSCILVKVIMEFPDISLLEPVTAASVLSTLGNFIKKRYFCELQNQNLHLCDRLLKTWHQAVWQDMKITHFLALKMWKCRWSTGYPLQSDISYIKVYCKEKLSLTPRFKS